MNIKQKMIFCFLGLAALLNLTDFLHIRATRNVHSHYDQILREDVPTLVALKNMRRAMEEWHIMALEYMFKLREVGYLSPSKREDLQKEIEAFENSEKVLGMQMVAWTEELHQFSQHYPGESGTLVRDIEEKQGAFFNQLFELEVMVRKGKVGDPVIDQFKRVEVAQTNLRNILERAWNLEMERLATRKEAAKKDAQAYIYLKGGTMIFLVLFSIFLGFALARQIASPIVKIKEAALKVGRGDLNCHVDIDRADEIGVLAKAFNDMVRQLSQTTVSRNYVENILQTLPCFVIVFDDGGKIAMVNSYTRDKLGYGEGELMGETFESIFADGEWYGPQSYGEAIRDHGVWDVEKNLVNREGETIPVLFSATSLIQGEPGSREMVGLGLDLTERKRLEKEIIEISEREQQRIGQDLHDGLGQHLTGVALMSKLLQKNLEKEGREETEAVGNIVAQINEGIHQTRTLARGLYPVELEQGGLSSALEDLVQKVEETAEVNCNLLIEGEEDLPRDLFTTSHLYRIAQEAINNAVKHGRAGELWIHLSRLDHHVRLEISDDGIGMAEKSHVEGGGMGLRIMNYRARLLGGNLEIKPRDGGGTSVICVVQVAPETSSVSEEISH